MKNSIYIFSHGTLKRKDNTLFYELDDGNRKVIPVETVMEIHLFGSTQLNTNLLHFLNQYQITLHTYNYHGYYTGSFIPRERNLSGIAVIAQCEHYLNSQKRLEIASQMIEGAIFNMTKIIRYYANRGKNIQEQLLFIESLLNKLPHVSTVDELRGLEGKARETYYSAWNEILDKNSFFHFQKREKRPPSNPINALISFGNGLLYTMIITEIYHVHLHGAVSFVHEPGRYRYSLALDIADLFKPVLVDRLIFYLINHKILNNKHFSKELNFAYLNEKGRKIFIQEWEKRIKTTIKHPALKRNVSYRRLIRLELYKLIKHFIGDKKYQPFKMWW